MFVFSLQCHETENTSAGEASAHMRAGRIRCPDECGPGVQHLCQTTNVFGGTFLEMAYSVNPRTRDLVV